MNNIQWQRAPEYEKGVIVGCDEAQEWLLPWWWERYSAKNNFPVLFADFGMSLKARSWCQQRGEILLIKTDFSSAPSSTYLQSCHDAKYWEDFYGPSLWTCRDQWFKKPFACLASSFQRSVWIDLDCEVLQPIDDLFDQCNGSCSLALVREYESQHLPKLHPLVLYNGGVIVFTHGSEIIQKWAEDAVSRKDRFFGDDWLLSSLILEWKWPVCDLPEIYNWKFVWGLNINAVIYHWLFAKGKDFIKKQGGIKPFLEILHDNQGNNI